jgi:hypothetical protein
MAVCATPTSSAGHAPAGAKTNPKLTFLAAHLLGGRSPRSRLRPGLGRAKQPRGYLTLPGTARARHAPAEPDLLKVSSGYGG